MAGMKSFCLGSLCVLVLTLSMLVFGCSSESGANGPDGDTNPPADQDPDISVDGDGLPNGDEDASGGDPDPADGDTDATDGDLEPDAEPDAEGETDGDAETEAETDGEADPDVDCENPVTYYPDTDEDGFGDPDAGRLSCTWPAGYVLDNRDCDDTNDQVFPGSHAVEIPNDGVDQDCDGVDACRDLNCDGWPDIAFALTESDGNHFINSYVYLGGEDGYSVDRRLEIPTVGAMGVDAADLDKDGYVDLVFAAVQNGTSREINSLVYWGSPDGYQIRPRLELPTIGCADPTLADVNRDGWIDIVFSNRYRGSSAIPNPVDYYLNSYVYWNGPQGFSAADRLELPTIGAARSRVADLDGDGLMDIVFANGVLSVITAESYIYWGSEIGWGAGENICVNCEDCFANNCPDCSECVRLRSKLPTTFPEGLAVDDIDRDNDLDILFTSWMCTTCGGAWLYYGHTSGYGTGRRVTIGGTVGATDASVADLNGDGHKEIIFANGYVDPITQAYATESYIYWGPDHTELARTALPTVAASDSDVGDLNGDGYPDIVFSSHYPPNDVSPEVSQIYWGSVAGWGAANYTELPTIRAAGVKIVGAVFHPDAR